MRAENLESMKFGRLTAISRAQNTKANRAQWLCTCDCGNEKIAQAAYLKKGTTRSCGCLANEQRKKAAQSQCHPYSRTEMYRERKTWENMIARCYNKSSRSYRCYGDRGITVCDRWRNSFESFVVDMGARPTDKTLDRINTESGYSPENCQWATREAQANNRRNNRIIEYKGESLTLMQWSKRKGIKYDTLFRRLEAGWSVEKTLTEKLHHPHYK